jgi:alpha-L-fucosidase 2
MVSGGIVEEYIGLNEGTMWSGGVQHTDNPEALKWLPHIREALLNGDNRRAEELMYRHFTCSGGGSASPEYGCYQMFANLFVRSNIAKNSTITDYRRELRMRDAIASTSFKADGVEHNREYFASYGDNILIARYRSTEPTNYEILLTRPKYRAIEASDSEIDGRGTITIEGRLESGSEREGVAYFGKAMVESDGSISADGEHLSISGATTMIIYFTAATSYNNDNPNDVVNNKIGGYLLDSTLQAKDYDKRRSEHIEAYRKWFDRVEIDLGEQRLNMPTDRRLEEYAMSGDDPSLAALYAQYGRYLLISSTYNAVLPPNLQGIWAAGTWTPWNGDMHLNINQQMNHWPLEVGNLAELIMPLTDYVEGLAESGRHTAKHFYDAKGWCAHILANAWGFTSPSEDPSWGATNTCGAWISLHLWEHYLYTLDKEYLKRVYPVMRGAAEFLCSILIEDPESNYLVTAPTTSPENGFYLNTEDEARGIVTHICMGSTMDNQITREIFNAVIAAAEILHCDKKIARDLRYAESRLAPTRISSDGRIMEWMDEYLEAEPEHRHVSHLFGLYPASQISRSTPELMAAARRTLERRGDAGTGWSRAWKICFWARLGDGNRAEKLLHSLLEPALTANGTGGGTYPNLFCSHPPFQIDGNFGGAAGIMEMLIQSHDGVIDLLPAIPEAWHTGSYKGLCARGGIEVTCHWKDGEIISIELLSKINRNVTLRYPDGSLRSVECQAGKITTIE